MNNKRGLPDTNYSNLTFEEIKNRLVTRAKTYYPDSYKDFNKSSFGSMMIDMAAMIGEQLNFYTQFVANENFLETSRTSEGLTSAARNNGIEIFNKYTSVGEIKVYSRVPADATLSGPDRTYSHTLLKGMVVTSDSGARYTTVRDVVFNLSRQNYVSDEFTGEGSNTTYYIYEATVPVISGESKVITVDVGTYQKFLKVEIRDTSITEVISVLDESGNEYYQVENLSQDVVYREISDRDINNPNSPSRLVPIPVPRRFTVQHEGEKTFLVFGFGSEDNLKIKNIADPSEVALNLSGRNYVSDNSFDPSKLIATDKFGVGPKNTTLTISYRSSNSENSNAAVNSLNRIVSSEILFNDESSLDASVIQYIRNSISCENVEPINGSLSFTTSQEVSETIRAAAGYRGRAVTLQDYVAACYAMPSQFGSIRRASVYRDFNDLKRNLNLYVVSEDTEGNLQVASPALKNNLKKWINSVRMVTDSIDIFDAKILNLGIFFDVVLSTSADQATAVSEIRSKLYNELTLSAPQIGEEFSIGNIQKIIGSMQNVNRVNGITITAKSGEGYSEIRYDVKENISPDGGFLYLPENFIWEIKKELDITGRVQ